MSADRLSMQPSLRPWVLSAVALASVLALAPVSAQTQTQEQAAAPKAAVDTGQVEEVVVTARKTREKLSDVPLSITALTAKTLEDAGIKNVQDVTRLTPGLTINSSGAEATLTPTIRGLTNLNGGAGDPNVAVFLDGVYLANPSAISLGMIDVERVEIIKGPVSALYGRNAFAGVINYVSKKLYDPLEGSATVGAGDHGAYSASASLRGAIKPGVLRAGLSLSADTLGYTHRDSVNGQTAGGYDKRDGQLTVELTPTKALTLTGAVYYGDDHFDVSPLSYMTSNCGVKIGGTGVTAGQYRQFCGQVSGQQQPIEIADISRSGAAGNARQVTFTSLRAAYDLGWGDVSGIYGYNNVEQFRFNDFTGYRNGIPFATSAGTVVSLPELFGGEYNNSDRSLEVRLASKQQQALRWSTGLYGFKGERSTGTLVSIDGSTLPAGTTLTGSAAPYLRPNGAYNPDTVTRTKATDKIKSAFIGLEYDLLPTLTASGEYRHTQLDKTQQRLANAATPTAGPLLSSSIGFNNYRATLRFKPSDTSMVYISSANGTKGGGFNANADLSGTYAYEQAFKPETNTTLELGGKQSFMGGKLQAGLAVFKVRSSNLQINGPSDNPAITGLLVKNFGSLETKGLELDLAARPVSNLTINAGLGYVDSKFGAGTVDYTAADAQGCQAIPSCAARVFSYTTGTGATALAMDISGMAPPQFSKLTLNTGAQWNGAINERLSWFGRVDLRHESPQSLKFGNGNPLGINSLGARNLVNLRAGIEYGDIKWTVYVNNVTNNQTPDNASANVRLNDFNAQMFGYLPPPRMVGTTVSVRF